MIDQATSFVFDFNNVVGPWLPNEIWLTIELFAGLTLFVACIYQRVILFPFSSSTKHMGHILVKTGQVGLWAQAMMGLLCAIDAWWSMTLSEPYVHVMLALWCLASVMVKVNVFARIDERTG